jgi:hypothetical protein
MNICNRRFNNASNEWKIDEYSLTISYYGGIYDKCYLSYDNNRQVNKLYIDSSDMYKVIVADLNI